MQIIHKPILVLNQKYQDSQHLLQDPKFSENVIGFDYHAQRSTPPYYLGLKKPLKKILKMVAGGFIVYIYPTGYTLHTLPFIY